MGLPDLRADHHKVGKVPETGIYVRALHGDTWIDADIAELDKASLLVWLTSRGGSNPWAENVVGIILGHGPLHGE